MMRFILLALVMLSGCGRNFVDPALAPYVQRFEAAGGLQIRYLNIHFGSLPSKEEGLCSHFPSPEVTIDSTAWQGLSEVQREVVVFHELGHCILGRGHLAETLPGGFVASVMFPQVSIGIDQPYYQEHRQAYIDELFGK
jgi:hypothetical protein